jgi:hypothetical protein
MRAFLQKRRWLLISCVALAWCVFGGFVWWEHVKQSAFHVGFRTELMDGNMSTLVTTLVDTVCPDGRPPISGLHAGVEVCRLNTAPFCDVHGSDYSAMFTCVADGDRLYVGLDAHPYRDAPIACIGVTPAYRGVRDCVWLARSESGDWRPVWFPLRESVDFNRLNLLLFRQPMAADWDMDMIAELCSRQEGEFTYGHYSRPGLPAGSEP